MIPIKFGVCGLGRIGFVHCLHFSQEKDMYKLVAGCDCEIGRVKKLKEEYRCAGYDDFEDFLRNPEMELAIIATRSLDHAANAVKALQTGKYVLLEKPIAVTKNDLKMLKKADRQYPGKLFFLHNHRFEPAFQQIKSIISEGLLGNIQSVKICRHHPFRRRRDWQTLLNCGGGQLSCWGPHIIDQALQFIGAPVKDLWSNLKRIITLGDADDHVKIIMVGENGIVVDLEISDAVALPGAYCTVYGNRGSLICADEKNIRLKYIDPEYKLPDFSPNSGLPPSGRGLGENENFHWIERYVKIEPDTNMWEQVEIDIARHLYRAIRENAQFPITNNEAFEVVHITDLIKKQNPQFKWIR